MSVEKLKEIMINLADKFMLAYVRKDKYCKCLDKEEALSLLQEAIYDWLVSKGLSVARSAVVAKMIKKTFGDEEVNYILALVDILEEDMR